MGRRKIFPKEVPPIMAKQFSWRYSDNKRIFWYKHYKVELLRDERGTSWSAFLGRKKVSSGEILRGKFKKPDEVALRRAVNKLNEWVKLHPETARVYVLINPFNNDCFYLGSTKKTLKARLSEHIAGVGIAGGDPDKNRQIRKIMKRGKNPLIIEICKCPLHLQFKKEVFYRRNSRFVDMILKKLGHA
jgi:hypothetical protein